MADIPAGAQRSPDGNYWWDEHAGAWQLIEGGGTAPGAAAPAAADSAAPAAAAAPGAAAPAAGDTPATPPARTGSISIELGVIADDSHSHDDVVAIVERGGAQLPQGEAYA